MTLEGFQFSGIECGIKKNKKDLALIYIPDGASFASVTTTNKFAAPGVHYTREVTVKENKLKAILVNSGNANALTGSRGMADIITLLTDLGKKLDFKPGKALALSTGIIGKFLPVSIMRKGFSNLISELSANYQLFAEAIMTTDLTKKVVEKTIMLDGKKVSIVGIAKGSGMIQPNMATMFSFILTDATVDSKTLRKVMAKVVNSSFNCISVDGDASTNDSFFLLASNKKTAVTGKHLPAFKAALTDVAIALAQKIIEDGEGATKFVELKIEKAWSKREAHKIFQAIAISPLVKTALFGENPNFGRILCSAGKGRSHLDPLKVDLWLGEHLVVKQGAVLDIEKKILDTYMKNKKILIRLDLHVGKTSFTGWTTDLSYDYVKINAEYN